MSDLIENELEAREASVQSPPPPDSSGFGVLLKNIRAFPENFRNAVIRHGVPDSPRTRSQAVFSNLFLHIHSIRTHRWTLRKSFTVGLGVATTALFLILTVTGLMLMVYYKPTEAEAYNSIKDIHYVVPGGRLLRNTHRWSANLMVVSVFLHMVRVFFTASYQKPREFNWLIGIGLLVLTLALSFTGYCLPWDQLAYWAVVIGSNIAGSPVELTDALGITQVLDIGTMQRQVLLGASTVGSEAVLRFYWLHCIALPFAMTMLIGLHFWRIRKDGGMSRPSDIRDEELAGLPEDEVGKAAFQGTGKTYTLMCAVPEETLQVDKDQKNTILSWPHAFRAEMVVVMTVLAAVLLLGIFLNAPLKIAADPAIPENPAKAPWYFLGLQEIVSYSAFAGGIGVPIFLILGLASIPFLDRERGKMGRWPRQRDLRCAAISLTFAFFFIVATLAFRVHFGWLRDWWPGINQFWIILFNPGTLVLAVLTGYALLWVGRTGSTRLGAIAFFCCVLTFYVGFTYFGTVHRGPNWDFYWWPSQWPTH